MKRSRAVLHSLDLMAVPPGKEMGSQHTNLKTKQGYHLPKFRRFQSNRPSESLLFHPKIDPHVLRYAEVPNSPSELPDTPEISHVSNALRGVSLDSDFDRSLKKSRRSGMVDKILKMKGSSCQRASIEGLKEDTHMTPKHLQKVMGAPCRCSRCLDSSYCRGQRKIDDVDFHLSQ